VDIAFGFDMAAASASDVAPDDNLDAGLRRKLYKLVLFSLRRAQPSVAYSFISSRFLFDQIYDLCQQHGLPTHNIEQMMVSIELPFHE